MKPNSSAEIESNEINNSAISFVIYSKLFLNWTRGEHRDMDNRTRKFRTMHTPLKLWDDINRQCVTRYERRICLTNIKDT